MSLLVLGGYGRAGAAIAERLIQRTTGQITIAGRHAAKAESTVRSLGKTAPGDVSIKARVLDMSEYEPLVNAAREHDAIIVCIPLDRLATKTLVDACIAGRADCVDISGSTAKYEVLEANRDRIAAAGRHFVIDAGADPGLPGWLAHHTASLIDAPKRITVFARYRAASFGSAGVRDILNHLSETPLIHNGAWHKAHWWAARMQNFPGGLGSALALPFYLPELAEIPAKTGVDHLRLFHAGVNPATDLLTLAWMGGLGHLVSVGTVARWFDAAAERFTPEPMGISLRAKVEGDRGSALMDLWHEDVYQATVGVAVLATLSLMEHDSRPGNKFLWQQAGDGRFAGRLEDIGFNFRVVTK